MRIATDEHLALDLLDRMVRIPSQSGKEMELAVFLKSSLERLGLHPTLHEVDKGTANVYVTREFSQGGPNLLFNGHLDTAPVVQGWLTDPYTPVVKSGRMYGLGSADMKAGLAAMVAAFVAVADLAERGDALRGSVGLSAVVDEEAYSSGARALLTTELSNADAVILGEPHFGGSEDPIPLAMTGKVLHEITVRGQAAHGFHPERGINAVEECARIVTAIADAQSGQAAGGRELLLCTLALEGGPKDYSIIVPDSCTALVNQLLPQGTDRCSAVEEMRDFIRSLGLRGQVTVARREPTYEPFRVEEGERVVRLFQGAYRAVYGVSPVFASLRGVSDANIFAGEMGIPTVTFGPRGGALHSANEYVEIDSIRTAADVYARTAVAFLSDDDSWSYGRNSGGVAAAKDTKGKTEVGSGQGRVRKSN